MKAAIYKEKSRVELEEIPTPSPDSHEVLVRILACGICGSDVSRVFHGTAVPGVVLGHEWVGVIEQVGAAVKSLAPGDRVVPGGSSEPIPNPLPASRNDPPPSPHVEKGARGRHSPRDNGRNCFPGTNAQGGFAEYTLRRPWNVSKVPAHLTDFEAASAEPLAVAIHAVRLSGTKLGDTVAVIGLGPVGLFTLQSARLQGATRIIAVDPDPGRRALGIRYGASEAIDPAEHDALDAIVAAAGGNGPEIVFECAGAPDTLQQALESVTFGGKVVLVALRWSPTPITPVEWLGRQPQLIVSYAYGEKGWPAAVQLLSRGEVNIEGMTSPKHVFALPQIQEALDTAASHRGGVIKAMVVP